MGLWSQEPVRLRRVRDRSFHPWLLLGLMVAPMAYAQQKPDELSPITITRKPGHEDGQAQMMEKGKVRRITPHAVAAWRVRGLMPTTVRAPSERRRNWRSWYAPRDSNPEPND